MNIYLEINQVDLRTNPDPEIIKPSSSAFNNCNLIYNTESTGSTGLSTVMMGYKDCIVVSKNHSDTMMFKDLIDKHASLNQI